MGQFQGRNSEAIDKRQSSCEMLDFQSEIPAVIYLPQLLHYRQPIHPSEERSKMLVYGSRIVMYMGCYQMALDFLEGFDLILPRDIGMTEVPADSHTRAADGFHQIDKFIGTGAVSVVFLFCS